MEIAKILTVKNQASFNKIIKDVLRTNAAERLKLTQQVRVKCADELEEALSRKGFTYSYLSDLAEKWRS